jgi:hypothetical protein
VDGLTAANDLGLTTAVPAHVTVYTDNRLRPIKLGNQVIQFKQAAPSRLYWAGHPAMRVVQALHWLKDLLTSDRDGIMLRLSRILNDPASGPAMRDDLRNGLPTMPTWMHSLMRELLTAAPTNGKDESQGVNQTTSMKSPSRTRQSGSRLNKKRLPASQIGRAQKG